MLEKIIRDEIKRLKEEMDSYCDYLLEDNKRVFSEDYIIERIREDRTIKYELETILEKYEDKLFNEEVL